MKMSRITVEVTEKDIERAVTKDSYTCVVAQAIMRTIPTASHIDVDIQTIRFTNEGIRWQYLTPYAVQGYIVAFDAGDAIQPFSFQLREPRQIRRRTATAIGKQARNAAQKARNQARAEGAAEDEVKARAAAARREKIEAAKTVDVKEHVRRRPGSKSLGEDVTPKDALALSELVAEGATPAPQMYKKKQRSYGHRVMRINQQ